MFKKPCTGLLFIFVSEKFPRQQNLAKLYPALSLFLTLNFVQLSIAYSDSPQTMETIQNIKNFIRHGKQAKNLNNQDEPSNTHRSQRHAHSDPAPSCGHQAADSSVPPGGENSIIAAQVEAYIANTTGQHQKFDPGKVPASQASVGVTAGGFMGGINTGGKYDDTTLARIIAQEKESKGKLPKYPGLERYTLLEMMGDGAFSNVYRARDNHGEHGEVAIKVVRKFELNASQVSLFLELMLPPQGFLTINHLCILLIELSVYHTRELFLSVFPSHITSY